jgi:hypothetical protein
MNHQGKAWLEKNLSEILSDYSESSVFIANNTKYNASQLPLVFNVTVSFLSQHNCTPTGSPPVVYDRVYHQEWAWICDFAVLSGYNTYLVENGKIQYLISDSSVKPRENSTNTTNDTLQVFLHQSKAWLDRDLEEIISDFNENAFILVNGGKVEGLPSLREFFKKGLVFLNAECEHVSGTPPVVEGKLVYTGWTWQCKSGFLSGVTSYLIENGKIAAAIENTQFAPVPHFNKYEDSGFLQ